MIVFQLYFISPVLTRVDGKQGFRLEKQQKASENTKFRRLLKKRQESVSAARLHTGFHSLADMVLILVGEGFNTVQKRIDLVGG